MTTQHDLPGDEFQMDFRLIEFGETVTFTLRGVTAQDRFEVFPRYLERCDPERAAQASEPLEWLEELERETLPADSVIRYRPPLPGNYLARWTSAQYGVEYRYFAAIDSSYLIYRPAVWSWPASFPNADSAAIHNGGLPFDWCLASEETEASYIPGLLLAQQRYGGGIVFGPNVPLDVVPSAEAAQIVRDAVGRLRQGGLDAGRVCNAWYHGCMSPAKMQVLRAAGFDVLDGYVPRGQNCGLGAPYFPFYIGPVDYRCPSQQGPTDTVAFVFDFVGSWHFHGPIAFHRPSARGSWEKARFYIDLAAKEAALTVKNSGAHSILTTLIDFECPVAWGHHETAPRYEALWDDERGREFFTNYMRLLAFDHPRRYPIVFARAADYADYFRAHYAEMPRRIVSSITHDIAYDRFWLDEWHDKGLTPAGYVPVSQDLRAFRQDRVMPEFNMPVSWEFINYNDNRRACRFEYACPKPVHYYDLTRETPWPPFAQETDLPDPTITMTARTSRDCYEVVFNLDAPARFPDYLLAVWDIPREFRDCEGETNAKEFLWVENTDGNCRGLLRFDLEPQAQITVRFDRKE